jgi:hypothetical protein
MNHHKNELQPQQEKTNSDTLLPPISKEEPNPPCKRQCGCNGRQDCCRKTDNTYIH